MLIIALKRYHTANSKVSAHIQLPSTLELNEFTLNRDQPSFTLSGIICHKGSLDSGHYVAYCKNFENHQWYKFDDKTVKAKNEANILSQQAYLAFYTENKQKTKIRDGDSIVPIEWITRFKLLNNPGIISHKKYFCDHGHLKLNYSEKDFCRVLFEDIEKYSESPLNGQLVSCQKCKNREEKKKLLAAKEKEILDSLKHMENFYFVDKD